MRIIIVCLFVFSGVIGTAQSVPVDTVDIYSNAMHKNLKCVVVKPDTYNQKTEKFPVVYLLHGYSGSYNNWIKKMPSLQKLATRYNAIIVCPEGGYGSWYVDSPIDSSTKFETFITAELVSFIDKNYQTIADKEHRGITGLSMGGHGALMLAMRHQQLFGAASSMSGAVDLREVVNRFETEKRLGDTTIHANLWREYSVYSIVDTFSNKKMPLLIDCGITDIFIKGNRALHDKLQTLNIAHDYVERNGGHSWSYWTNALTYHLLFFRNFFDRN